MTGFARAYTLVKDIMPLELTTRLEEAARTSGRRQPAPRAALVRVLHVINGEHYAGAERVQDSLALRLPECGFEVSFACLKPGRFGPLRRSQQSWLYDLSMRSRLDLRPVFRLAALIRRQQYALVHTHGPRSALVGSMAATLAGVPLIHHVHTQTCLEIDGRFSRRLSAAVERRSIARANGLISVSPSISRYLLSQGFVEKRIWLVPNGVPTSGLRPWRPPESEWTIGLLALFRPRKGLETLLQAIARLAAQGLRVRLRAVGVFESLEYEQQVKQQATTLGVADHIDWVGFRSNVEAELRLMDVFVLPSLLSEGMPMSVLEAMAVGTPVVATRVDGTTDVIRHGEDGLLAKPGDGGELAAVLAAIIRGEVDLERIRRTAHERQLTMFSDRAMAAGVADVYRAALY